MGDRVVWLSDGGPEFGFVRWVGHNPDSRDDYIAGVEFVSWNKIRALVSDQDDTLYSDFRIIWHFGKMYSANRVLGPRL